MLVLQSFGFGTSCVLIFLFSFSYIFDTGEPITCMLQTDSKPNQVLRTENEANKKAIAVPGTKKRINNQWVPSNHIHRSLDLEGKEQLEILPSFPGTTRNPGELTLVRIFTLFWFLPVLLGFYLQAPEKVGFKVESVVLYLPECGKVFH